MSFVHVSYFVSTNTYLMYICTTLGFSITVPGRVSCVPYIILVQRTYTKKINKVGVDELSKEGSSHVYSMGDDKVKSDLDKYVDIFVSHVSENIFDLFPKKNDAQIADAILELFRRREDLEVFNKKALYIYIREMVDVKTPKITKIADKLYEVFKSQYIFYLENGYTRF